MASLIIEETKDTLGVNLDKLSGEFKFSGNSMPENSRNFFEPIIKWIENYIEEPNEETIVHFKMTYFNTSSTKSIFDIIALFNKLAKQKKSLLINWYFMDGDRDMEEAGRDYSEMVNFGFNFIKY